MTRSEAAGLYDNSIFSFLRNPHTVFHSGCINFHFHQQCRRIPFSPHPLQNLLFVDCLMLTMLTNIKWYFIVVLICVSLIMNSLEHLLICLLIISVCLLWKKKKKTVSVFRPYFNWVFSFLILNCMNCFYILDINPLLVISFTNILSY